MTTFWPVFLMLASAALPLLGAMLLATLGRRFDPPLAGYVGVAFSGFSLVAALAAMVAWLSGSGDWGYGHLPIVRGIAWMPFGPGTLTLAAIVDSLACSVAIVVALVGSLVCLFSLADTLQDPRSHRQFTAILTCQGAALLACCSATLLQVVAAGLVGFVGGWLGSSHDAGQRVLARRAGGILIGGATGAALLLLSASVLMAWCGGTSFSLLWAKLGDAGLGQGVTLRDGPIGNARLTLALIPAILGAAAWAAVAPLHTWATRTSHAPRGPAVAALLLPGAVALLILLRLFPLLTPDVKLLLTLLGGASVAVGTLTLIAQRDLRGVLPALVTINHGAVFLALSIGSWNGAAMLGLAQLLAMAGVGIGIGAVIRAVRGQALLAPLGGLVVKMPITSAALALAMLCTLGMPFTGVGHAGGIVASHLAAFVAIGEGGYRVLPLLLAGASVLAGVALVRVWMLIFFGPPRHLRTHARAMEPALAWGACAAAAVFAMFSGYGWFPLRTLVEQSRHETTQLAIASQPTGGTFRGFETAWPGEPPPRWAIAVADRLPADPAPPTDPRPARPPLFWLAGVVLGSAVWYRGGAWVGRAMGGRAPAAIATTLRSGLGCDDLVRALVGGVVGGIGFAVARFDAWLVPSPGLTEPTRRGTPTLRLALWVSLLLLAVAAALATWAGGGRW